MDAGSRVYTKSDNSYWLIRNYFMHLEEIRYGNPNGMYYGMDLGAPCYLE